MDNSLKISLDTYQGSVAFYVLHDQGSTLLHYCRAFPGVFNKLAQM